MIPPPALSFNPIFEVPQEGFPGADLLTRASA